MTDVNEEKTATQEGSVMDAVEGGSEDCPILRLPTEVLLYIFSYVDSELLIKSVSLVCRYFHNILSDKDIWKHRVRKRIKFKYPPLCADDDAVDWQQACAALERERAYWSGHGNTMLKLIPQELHIAAVDAVALLNGGSLCVSGSRDRCLGLWEITAENTVEPVGLRQDAHAGWIWALLADIHNPTQLFSSSWDNTVKCWDLQQGVEERSSISLQVAVLSLAHTGTLVACGTYTGHVSLLDLRTETKPVARLRPHSRAALAVTAYGEHYLLSAGEEGSLASHDLRNPAKPVSRVALRDTVGDDPDRMLCYPTCMSLLGDTMYAGDSQGYIWVVDAAGGSLKLVENCNVGHKGHVTSVLQNKGVLLTSSMDRTLRVFVPSLPPEPVIVLEMTDQVTAMDYVDRVLVAGTTRNQVEIFVPCNRC